MNADLSTQLVENPQLERRLLAALSAYCVPSLRDVKVEARGQTIRLRGRVYTYYAKQVAFHAAASLVGAEQVTDELDVATPQQHRAGNRPPGWRAPAALVVLWIVMLSAGCSEEYPDRLVVHPVKGQVTFNGKPAAGAFVVFHPKDAANEGVAPSGRVGATGEYELTTYLSNDGAPPGEYVVTVVLQSMQQKNGEFEPGPNLLPPQVAKASTSKIVARVTEGLNAVPITITR